MGSETKWNYIRDVSRSFMNQEWYKISEHFTGFTNYLDRVNCCFCGFFNSSISDSSDTYSESVTLHCLWEGNLIDENDLKFFSHWFGFWNQMFMFLIKTETSPAQPTVTRASKTEIFQNMRVRAEISTTQFFYFSCAWRSKWILISWIWQF